MLRRLDANGRMGQDWFTKYTLAEALHIRAEEVQKWIDQGRLKCRIVQTGRLKKEIIDAADFSTRARGQERTGGVRSPDEKGKQFCSAGV